MGLIEEKERIDRVAAIHELVTRRRIAGVGPVAYPTHYWEVEPYRERTAAQIDEELKALFKEHPELRWLS